MILIIVILGLALALLLLLANRRPPRRRGESEHRTADTVPIIAATPDASWQGETPPTDFTPGGGDFGGAGSSDSWDDGGGGDGDGDGGGD